MKRLQLLTIFSMLATLCFGQNQSDGPVTQSITTPIGQQFSGQEIFRFQPGIVTQLNSGPDFGFSNSRWFSIGELTTQPSGQTVFGLRFQLPNRALTYGYQDINDNNPRIQWLGNSGNLGDLEFRVGSNFSSTNSNLVATMARNRAVYFRNNPVTPSNFARVDIEGIEFQNGLFSQARFNVGVGYGVTGFANSNGANVGVFGRNPGDGASSQFEYAIYGVSSGSFQNGDYAGFFEGDVIVTGTFQNPSDIKLKEDVKQTENVLDKIQQLKTYNFRFKKNKNLNLSNRLQHGFIAQEVEKIYPELVEEVIYPILNNKNELLGTDTYKSVNYIGLISELTAAINELNAKVNDLEGQLETRVVYGSKFSSEELDKINKNAYQLQQNIPNPFSDSSIISYALPENQKQASILVFDLNGRLINTYDVNQTRGELKINATDLNGAGMYLYTLFANGEEVMTKRMILK